MMAIVFLALVIATLILGGATDASGAIVSCVATRSMTRTDALLLASACNFLGAVIMALFNSRVAHTVYSIVDLSHSSDLSFSAFCAGMCAVIIWSVTAMCQGFPVSDSHALMSGICGAAVGANMSLQVVDIGHVLVIFAGFFVSAALSFILGRLTYTVILRIFSNRDRRRTMRNFMRAQRISTATCSFMHGAQSSQKLMGVIMMGASLLRTENGAGSFELSAGVVMITSVALSAGTLLGGGRVIKKLGDKMVRLDASGGAAANMASSAVLAVSSLAGVPVSTTQSKACAMMGVGSTGRSQLDKETVWQMLAAWGLTFPVCAAIGFALAVLCGN